MIHVKVAGVLVGLIAALLFPSAVTAAPSIPPYVRTEYASILERWLERNPSYRIATDADCDCAEDIRMMRRGSDGAWRPDPFFHPYYTVGDFNWDGQEDFAVAVARGKNPTHFVVVLFQGPFGPRHSAKAAFVSEPLRLGQALFFGRPRPLPHMLVVGPFESEGMVLRPSVNGYTWEATD